MGRLAALGVGCGTVAAVRPDVLTLSPAITHLPSRTCHHGRCLTCVPAARNGSAAPADAGDGGKAEEPDIDPADVKVILLGDSAVGKSKLVERFLMDDYHPRQVRHRWCCWRVLLAAAGVCVCVWASVLLVPGVAVAALCGGQRA